MVELKKELYCSTCLGFLSFEDLEKESCPTCGQLPVLTAEGKERLKEKEIEVDSQIEKLERKRGKMEKRYEKRSKKRYFNPKKMLPWFLILGLSFLAYYYSSTQILRPDSLGIDFDEVWEWLLLFGAGLLFFVIAVVQVGGNGVGVVSTFFARIAKFRMGPISRYVPKAIHANTRRIKNMIGSLIVGTCLVVSLVVLHDTLMRGNTTANRTYLGGDIVIFDPAVHASELDEIEAIEGVADLTTYLHFTMDLWKFAPTSAVSSYIVNTADNYGGKTNNMTEQLNVVVVDPDEYKAMNPEISVIHNEFYDPLGTVYEIDKPNAFESPSAFVDRLKQPYSTIIQTSLLETLGKKVGDTFAFTLNGFETDLEIVGTASNMPAVPYMKFLDSEDESGTFGVHHRSMIISKDTFSAMLSDFIGNVDIVMKNKSVYDEFAQYTNETIPEGMIGYTSGRMTEATRNTITPLITAVAGVEGISYRFSSFAPGFPNVNATYDPAKIVYLQPNVTMNQSGMVELPNRLYLFNPEDEVLMTGCQENVLEAHSWLKNNFAGVPQFGWTFGPRDKTVSEVLYTIDNYINPTTRNTVFNNDTLCVVNKYVTMYEDIDNMTWVYEMDVGDVLAIELPKDNVTSTIFNLTVAATLDNHYAFFHQNGTEREGYKLSSKSLNYDFQANYTDVNKTLFDLFDAEANVIYTSFNELAWSYPWTPQELDDLRNHAYISVQDGYDASEVAENIATAINAVALNYSVFPYKETFLDRSVNMGVVAISIADGYTEEEVLENLREWFIANGYDWKVSNVGTMTRMMTGSDIPIVTPIFRVFMVVAIFSLLASAIGLCTIVYANIRKRHREFGIYKALGFKNSTIKEVIFFETFVVTIIGVFLGIFAGLAMMYILYQAVSVSALIPMAFSIPIWTLVAVTVTLSLVTIGASQIISKRIQKLSIAENIRYRE